MSQDLAHAHDHLAGPQARRRIWLVFALLFIVTALEFVIAFKMDRGTTRNFIFIGMTLFKAFYIVAYFMHLKDEVRGLVMTILLPLLFIVWLIVAMLVEGIWYINGWFEFLTR